MKKFTILGLAGILVLALWTLAPAQLGGWGRWGGMMHDYGDRPYRGGWMHRDFDEERFPGYCWNYPGDRSVTDSADEAKAKVEEYLKDSRNPNLKVGEVTEKDDAFEVGIVTKDGSLADKVLVEKRTGRIFPAYR